MRTSHTASRILILGFAVACMISACSDDNKSDGGDEQADGDCTPGELDCACNEGLCLGDLECVNDMCVSPCTPGELGCACNEGQCLSGLECSGNVCVDPNCTPGELLCECNDGQCLGDLECVRNVCMESSGDTTTTTTGDGDTTTTGDGDTTTTTGDTTTGDTTTDTTDTTGDGDTTTGGDCPNANEMMCDGQCIDIMDNDENCGECGNVCGTNDQVGGCTEGICDPFWGECVPAAEFTNCNDACALSEQACVEDGCLNWTITIYDTIVSCEPHSIGGNTESAGPCDFEYNVVGDYAACCCQ